MLLDLSRRCCGEQHARVGVPADAVDDVVPDVVVSPGSVDEVATVLAASAPWGASVTVRGGGTKMALGAAPRSLGLLVDTTRLDTVVDHSPADLVVQVQAGVRLPDLQALLARQRQRLALDPPEDGATVGGIVASNASGPRRLAFGTARDLVLGATVVLADGTVIRCGGKVVKNVAGYDLAKLFVGSLGTLGVLAEVTLRLHPQPPATRVLTHRLVRPEDAWAVVRAVADAALTPSAAELAWQSGDGRSTITLVFEGKPAAVTAQAAAAARVAPGPVTDDVPDGFGRRPFDAGDLGLKVVHPAAALPQVFRVARSFADTLGTGVTVSAHAAGGVTWLGLSGVSDPPELAQAMTTLRADVRALGGHVVVVQAPPVSKRAVDVWGTVAAQDLIERVKQRFDPGRRMAPGRFVGGI